jgi:opacity protein-like surface antigen
MRFTLATAALALSGLASAGIAAAAPTSPYGVAYIGLRGSYVISDDGSTTGNAGFNYLQSYDDGYASAAYIGWTVTEGIRLEFEGGFRSADIKNVTIVSDPTLTYLPGAVVDVGADAQAATAMANFYYDMDIFGGDVVPWIGAGLGAAHVEYNVTDPLSVFSGNDKAWIFAYQLMAGLTFPIGDGLSVTASYHYFTTEDFDRTGTTSEVFKTDLTQHSIDLGIQWHL